MFGIILPSAFSNILPLAAFGALVFLGLSESCYILEYKKTIYNSFSEPNCFYPI